MSSHLSKFHQRLAEVRKGTAFLGQDIEALDSRLLHSYLLVEKNKLAIRFSIALNTAQSLHFLRSYFAECGRLEQQGKQLLPAGKFNIKLVCENGSNFKSVPLMNIRDLLRMEVFDRSDGKLVVYGRKSLESIWFKMHAKDKVLASPDYVQPEEAYAELGALREALSGRMDLPQEERNGRLRDLGRIEEILRETEGTRKKLEGNDILQASRAAKTIGKIEADVKAIKDAHLADAKSGLDELKRLSDAGMPHIANKAWPLTAEQAEVFAQIICTHGSKRERGALEGFVASYSDEINRNTVPAPMQPKLSEFLKLAKIAAHYTIAKSLSHANGGDDGKAESMGLRLREITQCVEAISAATARLEELDLKFDSGRLSASKNLPEAFAAVWEMGVKRRQIWLELERMKTSLAMLCTVKKGEQDGRGEFDRLSVVIPIAAAQNFTRITRAEADLWKSLMDCCKPLMKRYLSEHSRDIERGINTFISKAKEGHAQPQKKSKRGLKEIVSEHDLAILGLIDDLAKLSPMLNKTLYEIFNDTKSHLLYKLGGVQILCPDLRFHLTPERLLIETDPGSPDLLRLHKLNAELFGLLDKHGLPGLVLEQLDRFNHFEPNALDSNPDYRKLVTGHSQGKEIELPYTHCVEPFDGGERIKIIANASRVGHEAYLPNAVPGYSPDQFEERTMDEILYGTKQPLLEYLFALHPWRQREDASALGAYTTIYSTFMNRANQEDFLHIREMLQRPETHEFLASFSLKRRMINGAIFIPGKGPMAFNDPLRIEGRNDLLEAAGLPPEKAEYYRGKVDWYLKLTPARIMLHSMHSRKWGWALECAKKIATDPPKPANLAFSWQG